MACGKRKKQYNSNVFVVLGQYKLDCALTNGRGISEAFDGFEPAQQIKPASFSTMQGTYRVIVPAFLY